jgi:hypothetical protein
VVHLAERFALEISSILGYNLDNGIVATPSDFRDSFPKLQEGHLRAFNSHSLLYRSKKDRLLLLVLQVLAKQDESCLEFADPIRPGERLKNLPNGVKGPSHRLPLPRCEPSPVPEPFSYPDS